MVGVLTVGEIVVQRPDYIKLKDLAGRSWNVNRPELIPLFAVGKQLEVDYSESQPAGQKFPARWINAARPAPPGSVDTFQPKSFAPQDSGGHAPKAQKPGEFRSPEQIMRTYALQAATQLMPEGSGTQAVIDVAETFFVYIRDGDVASRAKAVLGATEEDIPF